MVSELLKCENIRLEKSALNRGIIYSADALINLCIISQCEVVYELDY